MKTSPVTPADIAASVMAVPPLAMTADYGVADAANRAAITHIEGGGIKTLVYAGNANVYNLNLATYTAMAELIAAAAAPSTWVLPGIGPDFGKLMEQAPVLRRLGFPTALVMPTPQAIHPAGVERGLRLTADKFGRPLMLYLRSESYLPPDRVGALVADGTVIGIKYALDRADPMVDAYLDRLLQVVDPALIVSGMGERPAVAHTADWKLAAFTSGLVCVAPDLSQAILAAVKAGDAARARQLARLFTPLEDAREKYGFIRVLHDVLRLAGVCDTGPVLPLLSPLSEAETAVILPLVKSFKEAYTNWQRGV